MKLDKLRYSLTKHIECFFFTHRNEVLLIHPTIKSKSNLLERIKDDIELMPEIEKTLDDIDIKFYTVGYKEELYYKSELLAFIYAAINSNWDIIKCFDTNKCLFHFCLKQDDIIYDPSLALITTEEIYSNTFKQLKIIKNKDILDYLRKKNNLFKFYNKNKLKKDTNFSINFIERLIKEFNKNIENQYILNEETIKEIKNWITHDNFIRLRQVLTRKRISYLKSNNISIHPSVDKAILNDIEKANKNISKLMKEEYNIDIDYYSGTFGNCYGLSILLNLYNEKFKLIQGYIPYKSVYHLDNPNRLYQHSWLEIGEYVYDPAFKIITPKHLYYLFVKKQDEYSKEDTENILRRIGFNLTHFKDFITGKQIGRDETVRYRNLVNKIDSLEMKEEGEKLISHIKSLKRY